MKIEHIRGDIIDLTKLKLFDVVAHGCNCFNTMGAGIAPKLNKLSNGMLLEADRMTQKGDINKLGTFTSCDIRIDDHNVQLCNLYTQYGYGPMFGVENPIHIYWGALYTAMVDLIETSPVPDRIAIPYIGCGLAGGRKEQLMFVLDSLINLSGYRDNDITIYLIEWDGNTSACGG